MIKDTIKKQVHLHDKAFRSAMSDLRVAKDFLHHYLPAAVKAKIDFTTLALRKESYIDEELKLLITDVLYSVALKHHKQPAFIYVMCEHLSSPQKLMPWRVIKYSCRNVDQHLKETKGETLPFVMPLVVYNGQVAYPYATNVYELFHPEEKELAQQYMFQQFQLIDFTQIPDEIMRGHQWSSLMEILLKHTFSRDMMSYLESLADAIRQLAKQQADEYILGMLKYVIESTQINDKDRFRAFLQSNLSKPLEQQTMTLAQLWQEEGFQQGIQQGMQQGEHEGKYSLLLRQLERKFKYVSADYRKKLMHADTKTLLHWGERLLDANTLEEVFE